MKISFDSLIKGLRPNSQDVEVGQQIAPFTGISDEATNNISQVNEGTSTVANDYQLAPDDGVSIYPIPVTMGEDITVQYNGLLSQSGAQEVYLHCGLGPGEWQRIQDIPMKQQSDGSWIAKVSQVDGEQLSFCFRDSANNWDNNNGRDWTLNVHFG